MRAGAAVLLLALFCNSLVAPLLSDVDSRLPKCCRRNGAHKCAMTMAASSLSNPGWFAAPCRSYPGPQAIPTPAGAGPAVFSDTSAGLVSSESPLLSTRDGRYRVAFDRSHQKRGPPVLLS